MSSRSKEIECLNRLDQLNGSISDITQFLLEERIIDKDTFQQVRSAPLKGKELQLVLSRLKLSDKLQMLEYQWQVLPVEIVTITIVTDSVKREFSYQSF